MQTLTKSQIQITFSLIYCTNVEISSAKWTANKLWLWKMWCLLRLRTWIKGQLYDSIIITIKTVITCHDYWQHLSQQHKTWHISWHTKGLYMCNVKAKPLTATIYWLNPVISPHKGFSRLKWFTPGYAKPQVNRILGICFTFRTAHNLPGVNR